MALSITICIGTLETLPYYQSLLTIPFWCENCPCLRALSLVCQPADTPHFVYMGSFSHQTENFFCVNKLFPVIIVAFVNQSHVALLEISKQNIKDIINPIWYYNRNSRLYLQCNVICIKRKRLWYFPFLQGEIDASHASELGMPSIHKLHA